MALPKTQTAVIQSQAASRESGLRLAVSTSKPIPELPTPYHVLIRVLAVGLNPTDYKMVTHFFMEGNTVGCDFSGIVEVAGSSSIVPSGVRVCGADFPYRPDNSSNGAFAQYVVADSRHTIRVPDGWSDTQAAALGSIGWCTACLAISDPEALNLKGLPSRPAEKPSPVLVYGGATATGIMAIQMLKHVLARVGARYACLEDCPKQWRTRRAVKSKAVMGFEALGYDVDLGHPTYSRKANFELHDVAARWAGEVQSLLESKQLETQPIKEVSGGFEGVIKALEMLQSGEVKGEKLVVQVSS
ncbi:putative secondary metabolism biosynthetic enzyme [Colletotrichum chrysophilum]|uniref:putative secondary metabolism biosynthetic enzyme n=1 Tax=Colletotrichum chrysophilum TaxID=1836956 RepID=UPI002301A224|nr:putative secondary metabolism biosynthetic enzyme [Colletotrichum chrysophilum]KAJ0365229.1 putative secondary metabolism biosynthetic enzyme [Colletotrichum chrysophilum]